MKFTIASTLVAILGTSALFEAAIAAPVNGTDNQSFLLSRASGDRERYCTDYKPPNLDDCEALFDEVSEAADKGKSLEGLAGVDYETLQDREYVCSGKCCITWQQLNRYDSFPISDLVDSMKECTATCSKKGMSCWIRNRWDFGKSTTGKMEFCMAAPGAKCANKGIDGAPDDTPYP